MSQIIYQFRILKMMNEFLCLIDNIRIMFEILNLINFYFHNYCNTFYSFVILHQKGY